MKKKSCSYWRKKAWKAFSAYIRRREADYRDWNTCFTCGKRSHWKELQAGHFVDGRNNTVLYDPRLVKPQCRNCNLFLKGNKVQYTLKMLEKYTPQEIAEMESLKRVKKPMSAYEHEVVFNMYKGWLL